MSRFMQVYQPVNEGWGAFLYTKVASFILPTKINIVAMIASNTILKRLLNERAVKAYMTDQCAKILERERKKDPTVTEKLPRDPVTLFKQWWHSNDGVGFFSRPSFLNNSNGLLDDKFFNHKIGSFNITFFYDTDHIDAAVVVLYSKKHDKCIGVRIPTPKSGSVTKTFKEE